MVHESMLAFSLFLIISFFGKCLSLNFDCDSIYDHNSWPLVENDEYCGSYDKASPYTYLDPEQRERLQEASDSKNGVPTNISARILRGKNTIKVYPWLAQLIRPRYSSGAPVCGGSLINKRYVLTAVHCVSHVAYDGEILQIHPANEFRVRLGAHKRYNLCDKNGTCKGFEEIEVEKIITPDNIISKQFDEEDIALLRLKTDVVFTNGIISPICLPKCTMINDLFVGKKMVFAGWGANNSVPNTEYPEDLQKYYPVVINPSDCSTRGYNRERMICTGGNVGLPCAGDSGGPLMLLSKEVENETEALTIQNIYYQIGVYSGKIGKCDKRKPERLDEPTYTRVAKYMTWILQNVEA